MTEIPLNNILRNNHPSVKNSTAGHKLVFVFIKPFVVGGKKEKEYHQVSFHSFITIVLEMN